MRNDLLREDIAERQISVLEKLTPQELHLLPKPSLVKIPHPCGRLAGDGFVAKNHLGKRGLFAHVIFGCGLVDIYVPFVRQTDAPPELPLALNDCHHRLVIVYGDSAPNLRACDAAGRLTPATEVILPDIAAAGLCRRFLLYSDKNYINEHYLDVTATMFKLLPGIVLRTG
jgi:hypothetical protein